MADNSQKIWIGQSLRNLGEARAQDSAQAQTKALPCTVTAIKGSFVTVKFEVQSGYTLPTRTIPQAMSQWTRHPTQVGDKGMAVPSNLQLGGQSGESSGAAGLQPRGNLTGLVFQHISQKGFSVVDSNAHNFNAPNGVVLQDTGGACVFTLTPTGAKLVVGGTTFNFTAAGLDINGGAAITAAGNITAGVGGGDSVTLQNHTHAGGPKPDPGT